MSFTLCYRMDEAKEFCCPVDLKDLDSSISGVEMDGGIVNFVLDANGNKVTAESIGSQHIEAF